MVKQRARDRSQINAIDYMLMGVGSCLAAFSGGMSIGQPSVAGFFVAVILVGTSFSLLVRTLIKKSWLLKVDGLFYALGLILAIVFITDLNGMLDQGGFPKPLISAAWLCWMLALGSFATWRDGTLLFQAVPSIALFGLVGCYDTYRDVTFPFFGFLICLAILFARIHSRDMLRMATLSGFFNRADAPGELAKLPDQDSELFEKIKRGPWRWVAGPEWALASALIIILLSLLGAPVIRESVSSVSGFVAVSQPVVKSAGITAALKEVETQKIGQGPNNSLTKKPLFEITVSGNRYLRTEGYTNYNGHGWQSSTGDIRPDTLDKDSSQAISEIKDPVEVPFTVKALVATRLIPTPCEPVLLSNSETLQPITPGMSLAAGTAPATYEGTSIAPKNENIATDAQLSAPHSAQTLSISGITQAVQDFAKSAAQPGKSDYEKARLIQHAIESAAKYNLHAAATPNDRDPVAYFLFEQKEGYCDLFASSMVLGARSIGIPARYMTGFLPELPNSIGGKQLVLESDYHAWAELYFKNVGWVVFDPTEGAQAVEDGARGSSNNIPPWYKSDTFRIGIYVLIGLVMVAGLGFAVVTRHRPNEKNIRQAELEKHYLAYSRALERASRKRRLVSQTPDEYLNSVKTLVPWLVNSATELNLRFMNAFYGSGAIDEASLAKLKADVNLFRKLAKELPPTPAKAVVRTEVEDKEPVGRK